MLLMLSSLTLSYSLSRMGIKSRVRSSSIYPSIPLVFFVMLLMLPLLPLLPPPPLMLTEIHIENIFQFLPALKYSLHLRIFSIELLKQCIHHTHYTLISFLEKSHLILISSRRPDGVQISTKENLTRQCPISFPFPPALTTSTSLLHLLPSRQLIFRHKTMQWIWNTSSPSPIDIIPIQYRFPFFPSDSFFLSSIFRTVSI